MSLLDEAFEKFTIIDKTIAPDGSGGTITTYKAGIDIYGAMPLNMSALTRIANSLSGKATYTLTVKRNVSLDVHTVMLRAKDGLYYRTISGTDDNQTPSSAGLDMRQYRVEVFEMPKDVEVDNG